ncbi:SEFIR domain-containing protein [Methylomonas sp. MED-D]|uniref:SEFIR domain-containing protein n=1 Tax=unclassified Methylomonas TaxID=2608980 RepID=UPI0028A44E4E|nr:SEFIR domain-containing protein [Methylomonas sp. MV1]MDT4328600.1 SEFIR domain-containing protein [Methylomonas sp. MV1]
MDQQTAPKVFISYSHDSPEHRADVLALAKRLRDESIDCIIDRYVNGAPAEGWIRWMERQIAWADFVLVICTETYLKRFKGDDRLGGIGVNIEGLLISQTLYDQFQKNTKFLPLIPDNGSIDHVPLILKGGTTYRIQADYQKLYRVLTNQPANLKPAIGPRVVLAPQNGLPNDHARMIAPDNETTRRRSGFGRDSDNSDTGSADDSQRQNGQPPRADRILEAAQANNHGVPHQRQALIDLLAEQLRRHDLQSLVADYVARINKGFDTSFSDAGTLQDCKDFAAYLVNQADDEGRRLQVLHLLDALQDRTGRQDAEELLAYLLHTLVRKDEANADAINRVPFKFTQTLDLLAASRHNQATIPDYAHGEFSNGCRKSDIFDHSHYQPPSGTWNIERECREIAKALLRKLADPAAESEDAMGLLLGRLRRYDTSPKDRPLKGICIDQQYLDKHPFSNADVAEYFLKQFGRYLPVFVYGDGRSGDEKEYLHVSENDIRGMLFEHAKAHQNSQAPEPTTPRETNMSNQSNTFNFNNYVQHSPGTNITQSVDNRIEQALSGELERLKTAADQDDSIGKKHYAEIAAAADTVKSEIAKPQADKTVLAAAAKTLEGFKNIASITGSIEKISQILIPLLS